MKSSSAKSSAKKSKKKIPKKLIGVKQLPKYNKELKNMDSYVEGGGRVFAPKDKDNHTHTLVYLHHLTGKPQDYLDRRGWFDKLRGVRVVFPAAEILDSPYYEEKLTLWYDYHNQWPKMDTLTKCTERVVQVVKDEVNKIGDAE